MIVNRNIHKYVFIPSIQILNFQNANFYFKDSHLLIGHQQSINNRIQNPLTLLSHSIYRENLPQLLPIRPSTFLRLPPPNCWTQIRPHHQQPPATTATAVRPHQPLFPQQPLANSSLPNCSAPASSICSRWAPPPPPICPQIRWPLSRWRIWAEWCWSRCARRQVDQHHFLSKAFLINGINGIK
jgi:hypothetical protein